MILPDELHIILRDISQRLSDVGQAETSLGTVLDQAVVDLPAYLKVAASLWWQSDFRRVNSESLSWCQVSNKEDFILPQLHLLQIEVYVRLLETFQRHQQILVVITGCLLTATSKSNDQKVIIDDFDASQCHHWFLQTRSSMFPLHTRPF